MTPDTAIVDADVIITDWDRQERIAYTMLSNQGSEVVRPEYSSNQVKEYAETIVDLLKAA